jgi:hypothetical protein
MPPPLAQRLITPAEYLALERSAREKSEYVNGRVYPVAATRC